MLKAAAALVVDILVAIASLTAPGIPDQYRGIIFLCTMILVVPAIIWLLQTHFGSGKPDGAKPNNVDARGIALSGLSNLFNEGEHLRRNFAARNPTGDQVNEWWSRILDTVRLPSLEDWVTPGDLHELKLPSPDNPEALLGANVADGGDWVLDSERIQTFHSLDVRIRRLKTLIDKINSRNISR